MLSQTMAREVRAELGRQQITRRAFASGARIPYKRALALLNGMHGWTLAEVDAAAELLGVDPMALLFPVTSGEAASPAAA